MPRPGARPPEVDVTVIINTCDQAPSVDLALCALGEQDFAGSWEIIVVDDGSADATGQVVARRSDEAPVPLIYVRLPDRGMRWCHARNAGMRLGAGACLLFLDGDIVPDREVVRLHWTQQREAPCVLAGGRLWRNPSADLAGAGSAEAKLRRLRGGAESRDAACRRREAAEARLREDRLAGPHPWGACFGCHVSVPSASGVFYDESMVGWGPADLEFACRLHHRHGLPVRFVPEARAWHVEYGGAEYNPFRKGDADGVAAYVRQVCYMLEKHPDLDLRGMIGLGFDKLALDGSGQWRVLGRDPSRDTRQVLEMAMEWYARGRDGV